MARERTKTWKAFEGVKAKASVFNKNRSIYLPGEQSKKILCNLNLQSIENNR